MKKSLLISILKSKSKSKSKIKLKTLKYCCPDRKNKTQCSNINSNMIINTKLNKKLKYAIMTLLFGNDSYLPGILLLGSSIRKVMKKDYEKNIELCCMVTNDISSEAKQLILKIYDRVIDIDYLQIPPNLIKHKSPSTRNIYSKTFTKLRIFEMTQYDKILFLDADMLVIKEDIFSLFNLQTPATIFMGKLSNDPTERYFKNEKSLDKFKNKYCNWKGNSKELHGNLIPYDNYENERVSNGMNIESSVLLITPNMLITKQRDNYLKNIIEKNIIMSGDTEMISRMFKDKLYAIEPRFFGRWVNPEEHPELVVLDLYGSEGKPWDVNNLKLFKGWKDVEYWWKQYMSVYKSEYESWNNKMLDTLYEKLYKMLNNKIDSDKLLNSDKNILDTSKILNSDKILDTDNKKNIYFFIFSGFGNKVFYLIFAIYLYNYYNGKVIINLIISKTPHNNNKDIRFDRIFPKSCKKINYIYLDDVFSTESILLQKQNLSKYKFFNIKNLNSIPDYNILPDNSYFDSSFKFTYDVYKLLNNEDKEIFKMDDSLILDKNIINIQNTKYAIVHIRNGDKLQIAYRDMNKMSKDQFLIYTPQFYIDMINKILIIDKNINIYIITDSFNTVNNFIVKHNFANMKNVHLLNTNWLNSFYLFYKASYIVLSCSTFSMAGAYFNPNAKCYIVLYRDNDIHKPREEFAISPNMIIFNDKKYRKYILNYNKKLLEEMYNYKYSNLYF